MHCPTAAVVAVAVVTMIILLAGVMLVVGTGRIMTFVIQNTIFLSIGQDATFLLLRIMMTVAMTVIVTIRIISIFGSSSSSVHIHSVVAAVAVITVVAVHRSYRDGILLARRALAKCTW